MRFASSIVGSLILILLVAIPVGGTPALQKGSTATYDLTVQISFAPPICEGSMIACPLSIAVPLDTLGTNITGTLGWSVTNLSSTTAVLNVTKDVTISHDGLMIPDVHRTSSFNESIDLATRIISIMPFLRTEIDNALQVDQTTASVSLPAGVDANSAMSTLESTMIQPRAVYTMWWMNETLHQGQNVTVLVFPTKVVGAGSFDFQGKTRSTWDLVFNRTLPSPLPESLSLSPGWTGNGLGSVFSFQYDQTSGLLLSATADINMGFRGTTTQSMPCDPTTVTPGVVCNSTSTIVPVFCGFSIHASLTLASTSLNPDTTLGSSGTQTGGSPGGTPGPGPGSNNGTPGGSNGGTPGAGPSGGTSGGSNPGTNSGGTPSPSSNMPGGIAPWIYLLLAAVIVAIVAVALWVARRQSKKATAQPSVSPAN